jgi:hypothetical protein
MKYSRITNTHTHTSPLGVVGRATRQSHDGHATYPNSVVPVEQTNAALLCRAMYPRFYLCPVDPIIGPE